jgi:ribosomal-protein-alanine N-acetyltransferase
MGKERCYDRESLVLAKGDFFMTIDAAFANFPILTTNRLCLREIQPMDAEALFANRSDPEVMEFFGEEPYQSLEDAHALIEETHVRYYQRRAILWGITLKGEDTIIGTCTFFQFGPHFHYAEIGYELQRAYWRQGIMSEAISAILDYGFIELEFHRVEANTDPENMRSKNLLLKLGFTYEGNLRERYFFRNSFLDEHRFGLLTDEWLKTR